MKSLIPAGNEPSGCASIHLANAARVNNPAACSGVVDCVLHMVGKDQRNGGGRTAEKEIFGWIQKTN